MFKVTRRQPTLGFLGKVQLQKLKTKALRSGVWFKALRRIDRALVDLTIKVAKNIRSVTLAKGILAIAQKLQELIKYPHFSNLRNIGLAIAQKLSLLAQKWGNSHAKTWINDNAFVKYLAIMNINGHPLKTEYRVKNDL